jgi:centractin
MYLRAGFAGAEAPELCFPSLVGRAKHARIMLQPSSSADLDYVGQVAMDNRGLLRLEQPVDRGCVRNWDAMERVWKHAFQRLGATAGQHPVLLTEPVQNPRRNRERAAEVLFETLQVPAFYVSHQCPLALYASGRTTGVVLDCGEGVTQAMPIFNGFALPHATVRSDVGGKDVTDVLMLHLRRAGLALHTSAERQIVREMKEACCFVALGVVKVSCAAAVSTHPWLAAGRARFDQTLSPAGRPHS